MKNRNKLFKHPVDAIVNGGKLLTKLSKTWKYGQTTRKRPPKMQRFTGNLVPRALLPGFGKAWEKHPGDEVDLQEAVSYENRTTGVSSEKKSGLIYFIVHHFLYSHIFVVPCYQ